jgi:hypothetical protein
MGEPIRNPNSWWFGEAQTDWCKMAYTVTSDSVGLAIGPVSETANDVLEALNKARQMCDEGMANVSIEDEAGHIIDGDELFDCISGKKKITEDLRAV